MSAAPRSQPASLSPRLVCDDEPAFPTRDAVTAWLDVLSSLLRLPASERSAIRDELDEHLRERVRDLMLSGRPEPDAVTAAIAELGDAAALARRYHEASHAPRRRFMMNTAIIGLAGAALVTSLVAIRGGGYIRQNAPASIFQPSAAASSLGDIRLTSSNDMTWDQLFTNIGQAAKRPVVVNWAHLSELHFPNDTSIARTTPTSAISFRDTPLPRVLALINECVSAGADDGIDVREQDGVLVISTVAHLDKIDQTLSTFDLSGLVALRRASLDQPNYPPDKVLEEATQVIQSLVHSDMWQNNGGDRAQISTFDSRLFIKAPKRIMPQVEWVIAEMNKSAAVAAGDTVSETARKYPLSYADALTAQQQIVDRRPEGRIGRAKLIADPSSNSVIVSGTIKEHEAVAAMLRELDRGPTPGTLHAADPASQPPAR